MFHNVFNSYSERFPTSNYLFSRDVSPSPLDVNVTKTDQAAES